VLSVVQYAIARAVQLLNSPIQFIDMMNLNSSLQYIPRRALTFHSYGCPRLAQNLVDDARDLLTEAVQLRTEKLGDHYDTASSRHMLACCYYRLKDLISARYDTFRSP
jgi:hypothetical protein